MADVLYCAALSIPFVEECMTMSEWGTFWTALGVVLAITLAIGGGAKLIFELQRLRKQSEEDASLKRTEFFLAQHRRLFDDPDLYEVLCYLDGDDEWLLNLEMWDKKRKFLTFIEEIALLVNSKKLEADVAHYMFGHYALCALNGKRFNVGIDTKEAHWWVFRDFCDSAKIFSEKTPRKMLKF
jgi:hypothetical protein